MSTAAINQPPQTRQLTPPDGLPVSVEEAMDHLRVTQDFDRSLIETMISGAMQAVEDATRLRIMQRTFSTRYPCFPANGDGLDIPEAPLISVESVKYRATSDGSWATLSTDEYEVDLYQVPGRIVLKPGKSWPLIWGGTVYGVEINYTAGYATAETPESRPPLALRLLMLMLGHLYENREAVTVGSEAKAVPLGWSALVALLRPEGR